MQGRKDYTKQELENARAAIDQQLAAYRKLAAAVGAAGDPGVRSALGAFEPLFFNNMTMVLDRYFVHRLRQVTGKDSNPLNEVELLTESLMNNDGVLQGNKVIKFVPEASVLKLDTGERIRLDAPGFDRSSAQSLGSAGPAGEGEVRFEQGCGIWCDHRCCTLLLYPSLYLGPRISNYASGLVELGGLEPPAPCLQTEGSTSRRVHHRRSSSWDVHPGPVRSGCVAVFSRCTHRQVPQQPRNIAVPPAASPGSFRRTW
jgi:hypothetical protein